LWRQEWSRFETADEVISAIETATLAEQIEPNKATIWSERPSRRFYLAIPILALLVIVAGVLLLRSITNADPQEDSVVIPTIAVSTEVSNPNLNEIVSDGTESVQNTVEAGPTVSPTVTLTREAPPTSAMDTTIPVFGPLSDQVFNREDTISFAWIWLSMPAEDESFTVYIESEDTGAEPIAIGSTNEPDNASLYRIDTNAIDLDLPPGSYLWQVRLENTDTELMLVESDARRFIIAEEPTATPTSTNTPAPPTPTITETAVPPSPTSAPAQPSATAVVCVPQRPFGWVEYRVQLGDSISQFAVAANITVERILAANCLTRNSVLSIGQLLYIPVPPVTPTFTPSPTFTPGPVATLTPVPPSSGGGSGGNSGGGGNEPEPTSPPAANPTSTRRPLG
jgi:LysM repeat protein